MHVNTAFLIEERGARGRGIPRGSVGQSDATALCGGDSRGCRAPVRHGLTDKERAERDGAVRGTDPREFHPGLGMQLRSDAVRSMIVRDFLEWYLGTADRYDLSRPPRLKAGPVKGKPERKVREPRVAREPRQPRAPRQPREAAPPERRSYDALVAQAREGLDMSNPRHQRRFETRLERLLETEGNRDTLSAYIKQTREIGGAM